MLKKRAFYTSNWVVPQKYFMAFVPLSGDKSLFCFPGKNGAVSEDREVRKAGLIAADLFHGGNQHEKKHHPRPSAPGRRGVGAMETSAPAPG